jgi:malic enzyme
MFVGHGGGAVTKEMVVPMARIPSSRPANPTPEIPKKCAVRTDAIAARGSDYPNQATMPRFPHLRGALMRHREVNER